ncbi:hypothetical protein BFJ71_g14577 [Fusarium oxysporum]|nr:hypothetical protein BFJ71_g14577 [Fusarium oxysporum]
MLSLWLFLLGVLIWRLYISYNHSPKVPDEITVVATQTGGSAWGIHHNEKLYPNGYTFDPFRFVLLHKDEGIRDSADGHTLITPSQNHVPFGIGKLSCPGTQFAAVVTKVFLAYLAMNYDLEEVHEKPRFLSLGHLPVPAIGQS